MNSNFSGEQLGNPVESINITLKIEKKIRSVIFLKVQNVFSVRGFFFIFVNCI